MKCTLPKAGIAILALFSSACQNTSHLLVYQHTNLGLNAGVNPQTSNLHVRVGIRQEVATIVPKVVTKDEGAVEPTATAAAAYVAMRVNTANVFTAPEVNEIIASGTAAVNLAQSGKRLEPFKETTVEETAGGQ